ncbi:MULTISPECIES: DUF6193 family natural product biosynthesis protein [Streptomyces]|uniref:DUF6193 family natural product biosynthesis protein n=2 Tax=Streptomyces TaxID=1883 RepID=A0ABU4K8F3_9ACTN|nr:DUF6193 family natural product biosynthesis protein [Streptomyces roseolus]MDX2294016.1 DUF6193 family natural product biosynthesis protein [Streptomyces roseolus]
MPTPPEPAVLFPDIAAAGSLAAALRAVADGALDDVPLTSPDGGPLSSASAGSVLPHREAMRVSAWSHERKWSVSAAEPLLGLSLVHGVTDDLAQVAAALRAWHDGRTPDDVHAAAPFVRPSGRLELTDRDPARMAESEWRHLVAEAAALDAPFADAYRALVEAAYAEPRLRALYPFTSHWTLRFSAATRPFLDVVGPNLCCAREGGYRVARLMAEGGRHVATAPEAVAEGVRLLPEGLGPVRYGAARGGAENRVEAAEGA